jgi:hypothetical protein
MNPQAERPDEGDFWEDEDLVERPLPVGAGELPDDPWLREMAHLAPEAVRERLATRWSAMRRPGPAAIRDSLVDYIPAAIATHGDEAYLKLVGPDGSPIYLAPPLAGDELDTIALMPARDRPTAEEFYRSFPGLRDSPPGCEGTFIRPREWVTFGEFGWDLDEDDEPWADATVIFIALNGDLLLIGEGGIAWGVMARGGVRRIADDLDGFLVRYATHLGPGGPLDSYVDL